MPHENAHGAAAVMNCHHDQRDFKTETFCAPASCDDHLGEYSVYPQLQRWLLEKRSVSFQRELVNCMYSECGLNYCSISTD
jgi:hypothetical protein